MMGREMEGQEEYQERVERYLADELEEDDSFKALVDSLKVLNTDMREQI